MRIALYEPDIPQNTGTILRLAACLGVEAHIVEPAGFPITDRAFRRAGMDYLDQVAIVRHASWAAFEDWRRTAGAAAGAVHHGAHAPPISTMPIGPDDVLMFGRESAGVPERRPPGRRRAASDPDAAGFALDQCGDGGRHGIGRGDAADERLSQIRSQHE